MGSYPANIQSAPPPDPAVEAQMSQQPGLGGVIGGGGVSPEVGGLAARAVELINRIVSQVPELVPEADILLSRLQSEVQVGSPNMASAIGAQPGGMQQQPVPGQAPAAGPESMSMGGGMLGGGMPMDRSMGGGSNTMGDLAQLELLLSQIAAKVPSLARDIAFFVERARDKVTRGSGMEPPPPVNAAPTEGMAQRIPTAP